MVIRERSVAPDPFVLMLGALAWICADEDRALRLLALTGMDADAVRAHADAPATLTAVGGFLADHEPDLLACAEALNCTPEMLVAAMRRVAGADHDGGAA